MFSTMINVIKGVVISVISTLLMILVLSILLTYTDLSEMFISPAIIVITAISIFIGSTIGKNKIKKNGMFTGALIGGIYLLIIYISSIFLNKEFTLTIQSVIMIILGILCGMVGGILKVNRTS